MNVRSASPIWFRSSCSEISAHRSPISGRPPAPMPCVTPRPIRSLRSAWIESRCTASVFTTTVRAPWIPMRCNRWTEFPPAPPHPITRTFGRAGPNESRNDWFLVRCAVSRPIPDSIPSGPARSALLARLRVARSRHVDLSLGPFHGLVEPTPNILPDCVADRVLDGDGVARLYELLQVHDVPFRQFDHELADVVRRELHVDEPIDRRANRVGNRGVVAALDELMKRLDFVRGNSDRNPLGFRWHMDPCPRPTSRVILSDIRMATALFKRTVQTVLLRQLGWPIPSSGVNGHSRPETDVRRESMLDAPTQGRCLKSRRTD